MKKIYMTICLLTISTALFAQEKITWGVHAGINVSAFTDKDQGISLTTSSKAGFHGGLDVQFPISSSFRIQTELNFSQLGGTIELRSVGTVDTLGGTQTPGNSTNIKSTSNYLTLPILAKYIIPNSGFGIYAGPQYGYLLSSSSSTQGVSTSTTYVYKRSDLSGIAGIEYYFTCGFGLSARYQFGLMNVGNSSVTDQGETVKNHAFTFTVGYRF